jgi:murein L,D-transpeptidase YcbB/YkuD
MAKRMLVLVTAILFLGGCATVNKSTKDTQVKRLEAENSELKIQLQQKDNMISSLQEELDSKQAVPHYKQEVYEAARLTKRNIQLALQKAGFYKGSIDGALGPTSKKAIRDFQKANGLKADGVVGKATWQKLRKYL